MVKYLNHIGLTVFCGRQGGGKTISMVEYLDKMKRMYPHALVITNFNYIKEDMKFTDWRQFTEVRNRSRWCYFCY